jgi:nucleotide-binding universal stress UspA family protein
MKPRRILVSVDFSAGSLAAVGHAQQMAQRASCHLHLLHVTEPLHSVRHGHRQPGTTSSDRRLRAYRHLADIFVRHRLDPLLTTVVVRRGAAEQVIVDYAAEIGADLIVMGVHGDDQTPPHVPGALIKHVAGTSGRPVFAVFEPRGAETGLYGQMEVPGRGRMRDLAAAAFA